MDIFWYSWIVIANTKRTVKRSLLNDIIVSDDIIKIRRNRVISLLSFLVRMVASITFSVIFLLTIRAPLYNVNGCVQITWQNNRWTNIQPKTLWWHIEDHSSKYKLFYLSKWTKLYTLTESGISKKLVERFRRLS